MASSEIRARLELAVEIAREAGEITLGYFGQDNFQVERKADDSPVTIADRSSEQHLRQRIKAAFPGDGVLGEEFGEQAGTSGYRWILDPIDGTKSFIHGVPLYGTLIGVEYQQASCLGVIHIPPSCETVYAAAGEGAWYSKHGSSPRATRVGVCARLDQALFCTSEVDGFLKVGRFETFAALSQTARLVRTWGDCYGYLLVATGRADLMVDPRMHVWDAAALLPILMEAGGVFTDWQGQPTIYGGNGIATNQQLLASVVEFTREPTAG
jgi:histidinol phosphatase-like enzyme (inositol monophosphatase family)